MVGGAKGTGGNGGGGSGNAAGAGEDSLPMSTPASSLPSNAAGKSRADVRPALCRAIWEGRFGLPPLFFRLDMKDCEGKNTGSCSSKLEKQKGRTYAKDSNCNEGFGT